ncbi:MAG: glycosyltransferase family 9 protein [Planctomycetes bacterium]|nr:glycosyltransferase family 9 protein [Planctomycetota bacterium]
MPAEDDILSLLEATSAQLAKETQRAVILQPGALGDCLLTLPLVGLLKEALELGGVDLVGHAEYIGILPERTSVDSIRSIDTAELHRLFTAPAGFDLADHDPLIHMFADYSWIITFLGDPGSDFEQNLIFTANCSRSAEVITLPLKAPDGVQQHIAEFYMKQFAQQSGLTLDQVRIPERYVPIRVQEADRDRGMEVLEQAGVDPSRRLTVIHPGSGGPKKCWHLDNFLGLARELADREVEALFLLGPAEIQRLRPSEKVQIHAVAKCAAHLALHQVIGLLSCADAFVGNDSGVTHLAAGMGVRTIALFGPTDPAVYRPLGRTVAVFRDPTDNFARKPSPTLQKAILDSLPF